MAPSASLLPHLSALESSLAAAAAAILCHDAPLSPATTISLFRRVRELQSLLLVSTPPSGPSSPVIFHRLLSLYCRLGALTDARKMLDTMPQRSLDSYNAVFDAHSHHPRHSAHVIHLFRRMAAYGFSPCAHHVSVALSAATVHCDARDGALVHARSARAGLSGDAIVQRGLLRMYAECGLASEANRVFDEMTVRDLVSWSCVIRSNVQQGSVDCALRQFSGMVRVGFVPTKRTFSAVLSACGRARDWNQGRILHAWIIKSDIKRNAPLQSALLGMYSNCSDLESALCVFEMIDRPHLELWNTVIAACSNVGDGETAMDLFLQLKAASYDERHTPDDHTFAAVISAAAALPAALSGRPLHAEVIKSGFESCDFVGDALIHMYFMNKEPYSARVLFKRLFERDVVIWTEMVAGHAELGEGKMALKYFVSMLIEGHKAGSQSLSSALNSAADLAVLKQGEMLHAHAAKTGFERSTDVCGSLVDMYVKNGALGGAYTVFSTVNDLDLECWNSIIGGYANHGDSEKAFELYGWMVLRGMQPDRATYASLLSACDRDGLVKKGKFYWCSMLKNGILPEFGHYACMVSLLSRAGLLLEAMDLIMDYPAAKKCPELWRIFSSCLPVGDLSSGVHAAQQILSTGTAP